MKFNEFAWDGLTRLLKRALTWTGVQTFTSLVATLAKITQLGVSTTTPTGAAHIVLAAGKPMLIGGDTLATVTGVSGTDANPTVLTVATTNGVAIGDAVVVNSGTNVTVGTYVCTAVVVDTSVTLDRNASSGGAISTASVTYVNDVIIIEVASGSGEPRIVLPLQNDAGSPTLAFGRGKDGIYSSIDGVIRVALSGTEKYVIEATQIRDASTGARFTLRRSSSTATNPIFVFQNDNDTGLGRAAADQLSLIAGAIEAIRLSETTAKMVEKFACSALGGVGRVAFSATANITADHTITIQVNIPSGAKILGVQMRVDVALAAGETWNAQYVTGATQSIATNQAVAVNTKVNKFFDENAATAIGSGETDITIQKNSNPGVDVFTAQGTIRAVVYYEDWTALADL